MNYPREYEPYIHDLNKTYTSERYEGLDNTGKEDMINTVFNIYRGVNKLPMPEFTSNEILQELKKCQDKDVSDWDGEILDLKYWQGSSLCKYVFPNLHKVECKGATNNSIYDRFHDDHKLKRAIKLCFDIKKNANPSSLRSALELIGGNVATNFTPMKAKALYEKYCPENGTVYDYSCGFGGRFIGAKSLGLGYFGCEPAKETNKRLRALDKYYKHMGITSETDIRLSGSEIFNEEWVDKADFSFSSPPYFDLESYSNDDGQSIVQFPTLDSWLSGFVEPTIENTYKYLKKGSYYAVNIADFNKGKERIEFVDYWIEYAEKVGFTYIKNIPLSLTTRKGVGHEKPKKEGIFLFIKNK